MAGLFIGTSGWAYKAWRPEFYPEKLAQTKFLSYYASQLTAVEVNYTFRHLLTEKTIGNWLAQTPEHFKFALKANQAITHFRRLGDIEEPLGAFLSSIAPLASAGRLGPVLFQLPPQLKADPERLSRLLAMLPRMLRPAFEFRHESWFTDEIFSILRERGAALCVAENDELVTPEVHTAGFAYFRFRQTEYSAGQRHLLAERVMSAAKTGDVFAFFKHEERAESPLWAVEMLRAVQAPAA